MVKNEMIAGLPFDSKSRFLSSFCAKQPCYISRTPRHKSRMLLLVHCRATQPLKMLELKIGTKHIYTCNYLVGSHAQNSIA